MSKKVENKELIEMLAKQDWNSIVTVKDASTDKDFSIESITCLVDGSGVPKITLNIDSTEHLG